MYLPMRNLALVSGITLLFACTEAPRMSSGRPQTRITTDAQATDTSTISMAPDAASTPDDAALQDVLVSSDGGNGQSSPDGSMPAIDSGAGVGADSTVNADAMVTQPPVFSFYTPAWNNGGMVPSQYTCDGPGGWPHQNNPELVWSNAPAGTTAFVMIFDDPDAGDWRHWAFFTSNETITGIPPSTSNAQNLPTGVTELFSGDGRRGYVPNCPGGATHTYRWRLWAVDHTFVPTALSFSALEAAANHASLSVLQFTGISNAGS